MKKFLGILLTSCFFIGIAQAVQFPETPSGYVTDLASVISVEEDAKLESIISQMDKELTVEVAVLILDTLEGEDISQFTFDLGEKWGVGKKGNDNGLMIVIVVKDRDWFTATGYGLEGALPDAIVKRMGENNFPKYFRVWDYAGWIEAVLVEAKSYLKNDPTVLSNYKEKSQKNDQWVNIFINLVILFILLKATLLGKKKWSEKWKFSLGSALLIFILGMFFINILAGIIIALFSLIFDLPHKSGGYIGSTGFWGGSFGGGSSFGGFGGGSFGWGGAGGSW